MHWIERLQIICIENYESEPSSLERHPQSTNAHRLCRKNNQPCVHHLTAMLISPILCYSCPIRPLFHRPQSYPFPMQSSTYRIQEESKFTKDPPRIEPVPLIIRRDEASTSIIETKHYKAHKLITPIALNHHPIL